MSYRYIALVNNDDAWHKSESLAAQENVLCEMGMEKCFSSRFTNVFVSKQTPRLLIPGHGIIIGHLFSRCGRLITDGRMLTHVPNDKTFEKYVLENYWGEYLLIHVSEKKEQALRILRDPCAGMPCVYSLQAGIGFITSSLSIAIQLNLYSKRIDWDYIPQALAFTQLRTSRTGLSDIHELLPGCTLDLRQRHVTQQTSWSPWDFVEAHNRYNTIDDAAAEIRRAVSMVVKSLAEVDGAILLSVSGGLDSSIVAACLRGVQAHITCWLGVAPGFGSDEQSYAREMTNYLDIELQVKSSTSLEYPITFPLTADEVVPFVSGIHYSGATLMEELGNTHGATSFFSGNGGDTIFSYLKNASPAVDAFKERGLGAGIIAIKNLSTLYRCTIWKAGRLTLRKLIRGPRAPWPIDHSLLNPLKAISTLPQHPWFDLKREALPGDREKINSLIITQSYRNTLLSKNEGGFERIPLLSQPVMEACLKVPTWMWIWKGQNRFAARAAFADLLPERILNRQDKGAYGNHIAAIYRKNKLQMRDFLLTGHLHAQKFLDGDALAQTFEKDRPSDDRASFARIFDFCMIENWLRQQASN